MAKVVYLLGAGASYGLRNDTPLSFELKTYDGLFTETSTEECSHIIEGLPIVSELPNRMLYVISKLWDYVNSHSLCDNERARFKSLITDFEWAQRESKRHSTIDTFAKKLWLTKQTANYKRLKKVMSIYFTLEQLFAQTDKRYDAFFAAILGNGATDLPSNISIVSWNYDCQFELAYNEYIGSNSINRLQGALDIHLKTMGYEEEEVDVFNIIKLNGTALFYDKNKKTFLDPFYDRQNLTAIEYVSGIPYFADNLNNALSFAWEDTRQKFFNTIIPNSINDAETLVIIGYSFPFFNREVDKYLFNNMPKLKKIYIQDKDPDKIEESVRNLFTTQHLTVCKTQIEKKYNTNQFYLPPEL